MERYIGLDVHSTTCTAVVLGPSGRKSKEVVVETSSEALWELVQAVRRPSVLVMEEGNQSQWLAEVLSPLVDRMLVVQPEARGDNKTDSLDAFRLAKAARMGEPGKRIYKAPLTLMELRHASKVYISTKKDLTRSRARLKLLLQSRGLLASSGDVFKADARKLWSERLPTEIQPRARLLGLQIDHNRIIHEEARTWMLCAARGIRATRLVQSVPGIGEVRAPMIVAAMISAHRFRTKRQLWRYAGLAVRVESSSDWVLEGGQMKRKRRHGRVLGLNHDRNPVLKEAFVGAAQQIITCMPSHPLHQVYKVRLERGMKPSSARLTLARKIAAIVLAVWKHNKEYDPAQS